MPKKVLVKELVDEGQRLLEALRRKRFTIKSALWHYFPEAMEVAAGDRLTRSQPTRPVGSTYTRVVQAHLFDPDGHRADESAESGIS